MKDSNIFDDLMSMNADEWNQMTASRIGLSLSKIKILITHQELSEDLGTFRLQINRNDITASGKEQIKKEKNNKKAYNKLVKSDYAKSISTLNNYVVSLKNDEVEVTSIAVTGKIIIGMDFSNSQLENSYFNHCIFYNCSFSKCNMESSFITSCKFINCNLNDVDFTIATIARNSFMSSSLTRVNYTYAVFSDNAYINCDLSKSTLLQTRILFTGFSGCHLMNLSLRDTELGQITIINSDMTCSEFKNCYVLDTIFNRVNLLGCQFNDFTHNAFTVSNCKYDKKYKKLFIYDNLVYHPSKVEWNG